MSARPGRPETPDPATATSAAEFALLLARLHVARGAPSLRELERRATRPMAGAASDPAASMAGPAGDPAASMAGPASDPATVDGRRIPLSRSTISAVLNGRRLPSHDGLLALLAALGLDDDERLPWLHARAGLVGVERGVLDPPSPVTPERRRAPRWWWVAVGAAVATVAAVAVVAWTNTGTVIGTVTGTLSCEPSNCVATGPRLAVHGTLDGQPAADRQVVVMIRVESSQRWYVGPLVSASDGVWTSDVGVGNPVPQEHDRAFTLCLDVLPADAIAGLLAGMVENAGGGLAVTDLPAGHTELACVAAQRPRRS